MSEDVLSPKKPYALAVTVALLLVSFILILFDVEACLNIAFAIMAVASSAKEAAGAIATTITFLLGIAGLAYAVFSLEYHIKHAGEPRSIKLLGIALGTQAVLALVGLLIL